MKRNINIKILFFVKIFIIIVVSNRCDPADNRLQVYNHSDSSIYFFYSCDSSLNDLYIYKNIYNVSNVRKSVKIFSDQFVNSESKKSVMQMGNNGWPNYLKNCERLYVFIFSENIINKYPVDTIKKCKMYKKRLKFTLNDLVQSNWNVIYE